MKNQPIQKNEPAQQKFEKYPKNYQQNQHYKSVKQKLMTAEDDQDIIKFPFTTSTQSRKSSKITSSAITARKIQKYNGKKFQTIPMRTISYSAPLNSAKKEQLSQCSKKCRKSEEENKFASKNLFTNMKKLKDLRKTNYKNKIISMERKQNLQTNTENNEMNLDLFKLTSTSFNYKERVFSDGSQEIDLLRKLTHTQGENRNVIRFQKPTIKSRQLNLIDPINQSSQQNRQKQDNRDLFFVLHPVRTKDNYSDENSNQKILINTKSSKNFQSNRFSEGKVQNLTNDKSSSNFVRYSQASIDPQNQLLNNGLTKLKEINKSKKNQKMLKKSQFQHIPHTFRASFRVKHIEDNKNILLNTIKRKASLMERNELIEYLRKVVK